MAGKGSSMRSKMKEKLKKRTEKSNKTKDMGSGFKTYFDSSKMDGVVTWWAGKGDHVIDIIPYEAGTQDPENSEGEPTYVLDILVHMRIGPTEEPVVCPEQYGKPCPVCEEMRRRSSADKDYKTEVKPLKASRRTLYNVIVRDGGEMEKKGNQVFEIAHYFMEKKLAKRAKDTRTGGITSFSDPDEGKSIGFEREGVGAKNTAYGNHEFMDREDPITDEELNGALCLDSLIEVREYDDINELFTGESKEDSSDEGTSDSSDEGTSDSPDEGARKKKKKKKKKKKDK